MSRGGCQRKHVLFRNRSAGETCRETLNELRTGRMDSFGFERLIQTVLSGLFAVETLIVPRNQDKGVDIHATFLVAKVFRQIVAIQAKHWQPEPPVERSTVEQLIRGIEEGKERVTLGMVVTFGMIAADAYAAAEPIPRRRVSRSSWLTGSSSQKLIVEHGIHRAGKAAEGRRSARHLACWAEIKPTSG